MNFEVDFFKKVTKICAEPHGKCLEKQNDKVIHQDRIANIFTSILQWAQYLYHSKISFGIKSKAHYYGEGSVRRFDCFTGNYTGGILGSIHQKFLKCLEFINLACSVQLSNLQSLVENVTGQWSYLSYMSLASVVC